MRSGALTLSIIAVITALASQPSFAGGAKAGDLRLAGVFEGPATNYPYPSLTDPVVSPDGRFVFVRSEHDHIATLRRNADGSLTKVADFDGDDENIENFGPLAISPDGRSLYTGAQESPNLAAFAINKTTGALRFIQEADTDTSGDIWAVTVSPDGKTVYATTGEGMEISSARDAMVVFKRDPKSGALARIQLFPKGEIKGLSLPYQLTVSPDGKNLYAAAAEGPSSSLVVFRRRPDGKLAVEQEAHDGKDGFKGLAQPESVAVSPDGKHVYATGYLENSTVVMSRGKHGRLKFQQLKAFPGFTPRGKKKAYVGDVELSPNGRWAHVTGDHGSLVTYAVSKKTGNLKLQQQISRRSTGELRGVQDPTVAPDGKTVYAPGTGGLGIFSVTR